MSIPPLLSSTPPPPDQCDDDKDPEDFDVHYNLSQDEDDDDSNEYNYGNFTTYNNIPDNSHNTKETILKPEHIPTLNNSPNTNNYTASQISNNNNGKDDEEIIEDLDLKFDKVSICSGKINTTGSEEENPSDSLESDVIRESNSEDLEHMVAETDAGDGTVPPSSESSYLEENNSNDNQHHTPHLKDVETNEIPELIDQILQENTESKEDKDTALYSVENDVFQFPGKLEPESDIALTNTDSLQSKHLENSEQITNEDNDDDFGDFDNFKCDSSNDKTEIVSNFDPWGQGADSSNFEADFGDPADQILETNLQPQDVSETPQQEDLQDEDDDFGDFDDFKSSAVSDSANDGNESTEYAQDQPMFNLQSAENEQVIGNVINSIFEESLDDTESRFEGKLELSLCETWGHLMEVEERQPYMVNWNNALGQKTLLKALCIDSRNILYGPKWGYNMPKYALNLSTAPLQPQKPVSSASSGHCETGNQEKPSGKAADSWVDPFTSDGKEFTYAEALLLDLEHLMATLDQISHNHSALKISDLLTHACNADSSSGAPPRPASLGAFEPAASSAKEIYSATLDMQPLRQINLPDTHIFTPTDSEIPRSKTIHYDSSTVLATQTAAGDDDEYSDFQDFKGPTPTAAETSSSIADNQSPPTKAPDPNIACKTSMLQPIKVEPIMPTLNWPDPGHVKEEFDDYSDFISSTAWNNVKQDTTLSKEALDETGKLGSTGAELISPVIERVAINDSVSEEVKTAGSSFDDEFDTFQSATTSLPAAAPPAPAPAPLATVFPGLGSVTTSCLPSQAVLDNAADFDMSFSVFGNVSKTKTDNISVNSIPDTHIDAQPSYQSYIPNNVNHKQDSPHSFMGSPSHPLPTQQKPDILQPAAPAPSVTHRQAAGQILQPLSLESYSQINWPNPGSLDFQDLSRFNPVETLPSFRADFGSGGNSKNTSPAHSQKGKVADDDWGDFVSSKPKQAPPQASKQANRLASFADDDEWTDFVSSGTVQPQNGLNTISLNVHTNLSMQKSGNQSKYKIGANQAPLEIPTLNYVTPKTSSKTYSDRHFQNL